MANAEALGEHEADRLYDQYVKPLESIHRGDYVGVSVDGKTVIGSTLIDVVRRTATAFGKGNGVVFRVGDKVVGRARGFREPPAHGSLH